MIRAAIVGPGWWGRNLVNAMRGSTTVRFTTAHTRTAATAAPFCDEAVLLWVDSLDTILADKAIDAVVFATPHSLHADQVRRAAAAGKAVFVEKPFALTARDAHVMLDDAARAGIVLAVGFNRRFHPSMGMLREAVKAGQLGTIVTINAEQTTLHGLALTPEAWRARPDESPGGGWLKRRVFVYRVLPGQHAFDSGGRALQSRHTGHRHQRTPDADRGHCGQQRGVVRHAGGDFDARRIAARLLGRTANQREQLGGGAASGKETIRHASGPSRRGLGVTTDDDRHGAVGRLWPHVSVLELNEPGT